MQNKGVNKLVLAGLICAIIVILTMFVSIPIPGITGAYVNAGDAGVYIAAFLLGGPIGAAVAGVGSALADMLLGSMVYAPATLVIKAGMAFVAALLLKRFSGWKQAIAFCAAGLVMVCGYFLYEAILYGGATALVSVPFNLLQLVGGVVLGTVATRMLEKVKHQIVK